MSLTDIQVSAYEPTQQPRRAKELPREALEKIVDYAQGGLYLDMTGGTGLHYWDPDRPVSGADYIDHMSDVLSEFGLVPTVRQYAEPAEVKPDQGT